MQREYTTTFLGISADDIDDLITIRHRFDNPFEYRLSLNAITHLISNHETELKIQEAKYLHLIKEKQIIEKELEEINQIKSVNKIIDQSKKLISFPSQSFLNIRHWHKPPKSLKIFFQALACFFSITNHDFLTEFKMNHNLFEIMKFYHPSTTIMDEFRNKYFHLKEISREYIRTKSLDAYNIAIWMHNIEENERMTRIKQPEIENQKQLENKQIQLDRNLFHKQKEIQLTEDKIKNFKKNIDQIENHRQVLIQSN